VRRAGTANQRSASVIDSSSSSHRRRSSGNSSSSGNSNSSGSSNSGSSSRSSSGGNSSRSSSSGGGGDSGGPSEEHRTRDADAGKDEGEREFSEDDLEMHSEPELDDLDNLALEDGAPGADGWLRGSREDDDADALEVVYDGASLAAPELDEDTAHIFDDTELVGGDVHQLSHTHTVLACRDACASYVAPPASPPCRAWTLAKEAGHCWLKSKDATRQSVSKAAGRISGVLPMNGTMLGAGLQLDNSSVVNSSRLVLSRTPLTSPPEQRAKQIGARRAKRTV